MKLSFFKKIIFICLFFVATASFLAADTTYKVEKGDTLYSISRKYQITVAELRAANNLSENDVIKVGQKLKIPSADISAAAALATDNKATTTTSNATLSATTKTKEYTVVKGDTMYSIAKKNGMTLAEFMAMNGLDNSSVIKVGQKLKINVIETVLGRASSSGTILILFDCRFEDVRIPSLETRDQVPWHEFPEQDPVHFLPVDSSSVFRLPGSWVILDLVPECLDPLCKFFDRDPWLKVQREGHTASVQHGFHALAADLETDRPLNPSVGEIDVSELCLFDTSVIGDSQAHILEFRSLERLAGTGHRGLPADMSFKLRLATVRDFISLRNKCGEGREAGYYFMAEQFRPVVTVSS